MACELHNCCQFFKDNMAGLPSAEEYLKGKLCFGDYRRCNRYRIYSNSEGDTTGIFPHASDEEEVRKITQCLNKMQERPPE
jgi:hypothetical protein